MDSVYAGALRSRGPEHFVSCGGRRPHDSYVPPDPEFWLRVVGQTRPEDVASMEGVLRWMNTHGVPRFGAATYDFCDRVSWWVTNPEDEPLWEPAMGQRLELHPLGGDLIEAVLDLVGDAPGLFQPSRDGIDRVEPWQLVAVEVLLLRSMVLTYVTTTQDGPVDLSDAWGWLIQNTDEQDVRDFLLESVAGWVQDLAAPAIFPWVDARPWAGDQQAEARLTVAQVVGLQVYEAIEGSERPGTCKECGTLFVRQQGRARAGQNRLRGVLFCSVQCRNVSSQRDYRRRLAAKKAAAEG